MKSIQTWKCHFVGHYAAIFYIKILLSDLLIICEAMKFLALLWAYPIWVLLRNWLIFEILVV